MSASKPSSLQKLEKHHALASPSSSVTVTYSVSKVASTGSSSPEFASRALRMVSTGPMASLGGSPATTSALAGPRVSEMDASKLLDVVSPLLQRPSGARKGTLYPPVDAKCRGSDFAVIPYPADNDVLLGRGGGSNHHIGNRWYLAAKDLMQDEYLRSEKSRKSALSQSLVDLVNKTWGGRFLRMLPVSGWYEVDNLTTHQEAAQALRDVNTPEFRAAKRAKNGNYPRI